MKSTDVDYVTKKFQKHNMFEKKEEEKEGMKCIFSMFTEIVHLSILIFV